LAGVPAADVLLLNDDDLTYAKLRLDERSMDSVVEHIAGFDSPLARALCWAAAWDMVRDGQLAARDYVRLVTTGLPAERDINLVTATLGQARSALTYYADPRWAPQGWQRLARTCERALAESAPGSGYQLTWARVYAWCARDGADLAVVADWLRGQDVPEGLSISGDLRWSLLQALVAGGAAGPDDIDAELDRGRTARGERQAPLATARGRAPATRPARAPSDPRPPPTPQAAPATSRPRRERAPQAGCGPSQARSGPAGVVGELRQPCDDTAGQVAAGERGRHRQRGQLAGPVGQPPARLRAGDDLQDALVRGHREQHGPGRVGQLAVQLVGVPAHRVV